MQTKVNTDLWLLRTMLYLNQELNILPSKRLLRTIAECDNGGVKMEALAKACHNLGFSSGDDLAKCMSQMPDPGILRTEEVREQIKAWKSKNPETLEKWRFLAIYFSEGSQEVSVVCDFQTPKNMEEFNRLMMNLILEVNREQQESRNENEAEAKPELKG